MPTEEIQKETLYVDGKIYSAHGTVEYKNNSFKEQYIGVNMVLIKGPYKYSHRKMLRKVKEGVKKLSYILSILMKKSIWLLFMTTIQRTTICCVDGVFFGIKQKAKRQT